jgi:hypothetical protein
MLLRQCLILVAIVLFLNIEGIAQTISLENDTALTADVLIATLYAKTDTEKEYCENIIRLRDKKILPNRILYGVYRKSVNREKERRFTYFQTGLEILCKREGIDLEQSTSFKSINFFGFTATKPTATAPTKPQKAAEISKPFSFFYNLLRR